MSDDIDGRIVWLARLISAPCWLEAFRIASDQARQAAGFDAISELDAAGSVSDDERSLLVTGFAERVRVIDPVLSCAFQLLSLRPIDDPALIQSAVAGVVAVLASANANVMEALARLRVWDAVGRGVHAGIVGDDFFESAEALWPSEQEFVVARHDDENRASSGIPACVEILAYDRWDEALGWLTKETKRQAAALGIAPPPLEGCDRQKQAILITDFVNVLFAQGRTWTGDLAIAWLALLCDPRRPETFTAVLPQISWMLEHHSVVTNPDERKVLRGRLDIWWRASCGEWADSDVSIFRIAAVEMRERDYDHEADGDSMLEPTPVAQVAADAPMVVVMPGKLADERGLPLAWRELRDRPLPLVVCKDAAMIRDQLRDEYPHAWREICLLTQDLRDGQPVRMRPALLLGHPGSGKSRLVRRLAELIGMYVYRFDGAASHDGTFAGSPKSWSSAQPSVPARAVMMSKFANPIVMVDEIEKAGESHYNGNLWSAMTPFLERETAARYRETGLDAELDLSNVAHIATANSMDKLPTPLRDRFRVIKIPSPSLQHLPALAAQMLCDMAAENDERMCDAALAEDELDIIGRAWAKEKFSMRKLQRLVLATLEARDACARRH